MVKRTLSVATLLALALASEPSRAAPPVESRDDIMCRAASGVGFSYAYAGECWNANGCSPDYSQGVGYCDDCGDGNGCSDCPGGCCVLGKSCSHSGTWGADCSGFTSKVWQVPDPYALNACNVPRYRATDFKQSGPYWDWIPWADLQRGDAMATSSHVMIFDYWDGWGHPMVYEARGCYDGIVHNSRGCSGYEGARRHNITSCQCSPGQTESAPCGNCGTTTRTCNALCAWGPWSACSGQGCTPGGTQSQSCGNCGSQTRTCSSSCSWSAWSACTGQGCAPGAVESEGCGNCGTRTRSCNGSCSWSAWSTCTGQGECAPGTVQSEACCDCGTRQRTCSSACGWPAWSPCDGPDPAGGTLACDTGEPGPCGAGIERCVGGCLACQRTVEPEPELCDDVDNDCNGELNNGSPATLGDPPPAYAARRRDHSTPQVLSAGETGTVWVEFENVGTETWPAGAFWLASAAGLAMEANALADPATWPAWDVAAVLDQPVAPGEVARLAFTVRAPAEATGALTESFVLVAPDGAELGCPEPRLGVSLSVLPRAPGPSTTTNAPQATQRIVSTSGCQSAPGPAPAAWMLLVLLGLYLRRRRIAALAALVSLCGLAACQQDGAGTPEGRDSRSAAGEQLTIAMVSAASQRRLAPVNHKELDDWPRFAPSRLAGPQRDRIRGANLPVLLPADLDSSGVILSRGDGWYAASYRFDTHTVLVRGSRVLFARRGAETPPAPSRTGRVQRIRSIVEQRHVVAGVAYTLYVDCLQRKQDDRCLADDYVQKLSASLALLPEEVR